MIRRLTLAAAAACALLVVGGCRSREAWVIVLINLDKQINVPGMVSGFSLSITGNQPNGDGYGPVYLQEPLTPFCYKGPNAPEVCDDTNVSVVAVPGDTAPFTSEVRVTAIAYEGTVQQISNAAVFTFLRPGFHGQLAMPFQASCLGTDCSQTDQLCLNGKCTTGMVTSADNADFAVPGDFGGPPDLVVPDLSGADFSGVDMSMSNDMSGSVDMSGSIDMSSGMDFPMPPLDGPTPPDLTGSPPDLTGCCGCSVVCNDAGTICGAGPFFGGGSGGCGG